MMSILSAIALFLFLSLSFPLPLCIIAVEMHVRDNEMCKIKDDLINEVNVSETFVLFKE